MKDETEGDVIMEFAGVRAKCSAYKLDDKSGDKKCKGVKKAVVKI